MKKIISLLLSCLLIFSLFVPAFAADEERPSVYVIGARVTHLYAADGTLIFPDRSVDTAGIVKEALRPCLEKLAFGLLIGDYEAWAHEFNDAVVKILGNLALDGNGEASDGSYPEHPYDYSLPQKTSN